MSDQVAIMRDGKLVQNGAPQELYERPRTRFVADFLGKSNFLRGKIEERGPDGFSYRCGSVVLRQAGAPPAGPDALIALRPEKIAVVSDGSAPANRVSGAVTKWSYLGAEYHLIVETADIGEIAVTVPTWRHGPPPQSGQQITIGWDPDASIGVVED